MAGIGENDPGGNPKTLADTNVQGGQGLPVGQKLYVNAIKLLYTSTSATGLDAAGVNSLQEMLEQSVLTVEIAGKANYGQWKLNEIMGAPIQAQVAAAATLNNFSYGRFLGIYPLNLPIVLASQVFFNVTINHTVAPAAALDGDWLTISLSGILERLS